MILSVKLERNSMSGSLWSLWRGTTQRKNRFRAPPTHTWSSYTHVFTHTYTQTHTHAHLVLEVHTRTHMCNHWMTIPKIWPKPIPRLFLRYQIFRNRNFFPRPNFSETETDTFLPRQNFPKPKPRLFFRDQIFRNRNQKPQKFGKSLETET